MKKNERLLSLDVLRGLDLFMLVGLQLVLRAALLTINNETLNNTLLAQLDHAPWHRRCCVAPSSTLAAIGMRCYSPLQTA